MKITRKQLKKILVREFRDNSGNFGDFDTGNNVPPLPPVDEEGDGGPHKDWPLEAIERLKKRGYQVFVRDDGIIPFARQVYKDMSHPHVNITVDALDDGIVLSIGYARNEYVTAAYAGIKYIKCHNAMDVNSIMRTILTINKSLQRKSSKDIQADLNRLINSGAKDPEPFEQEDFLNSRSFLIDYYTGGNR